jgi:hypothetical protein
MRRELLTKPRFLVPLALLLWLLLSLLLTQLIIPSAKAAQSVNPPNPDCPVDGQPPGPDPEYQDDGIRNGWAVDEATRGTWGMDDDMTWFKGQVIEPLDPGRNAFNDRRHRVLSDKQGDYYTCYQIEGRIEYGEWWADPDRDWREGSDEDRTFYVNLAQPYPAGLTIGSREQRNLRKWENTTLPRNADILLELVWDDQDDIATICMDRDTAFPNTDPPEPPCRTSKDDPGVFAVAQGALVYDKSHGYKEIHPIRRMEDSAGNVCSLTQPCPNNSWPGQ